MFCCCMCVLTQSRLALAFEQKQETGKYMEYKREGERQKKRIEASCVRQWEMGEVLVSKHALGIAEWQMLNTINIAKCLRQMCMVVLGASFCSHFK